jgi:hypothetical protein
VVVLVFPTPSAHALYLLTPAHEQEVRGAFERYGPIEYVRVVRDANTGLGSISLSLSRFVDVIDDMDVWLVIVCL